MLTSEAIHSHSAMHSIHQPVKESDSFASIFDQQEGGKSMSPPAFSLKGSQVGTPEDEEPKVASITTGHDPVALRAQNLSTQQAAHSALLQMQEDDSPPPKKGRFLEFVVEVEEEISAEEFKELATRQLLGVEKLAINWKNTKKFYQPGSHRIKLAFSLVMKARKITNGLRGIPSEENGKVVGAKDRFTNLKEVLTKKVKDRLKAEITRRVEQETGLANNQNKEPNQSELAFKRQVRDEVLAQYDYLERLPDSIMELMAPGLASDKGPFDGLEHCYQLAKSLEELGEPGLKRFRQNLKQPVKDAKTLARSLEDFLTKSIERNEKKQTREKVQAKLYGLEDVYRLYKLYQANNAIKVPNNVLGAAQAGIAVGRRNRELLKQMNPALKAHGFEGGIQEFEGFLNEFKTHYVASAQNLTLDYLDQYEEMLSGEAVKFKDPKVVGALHQKLSKFRKHDKSFRKHKKEEGFQFNSYPIGSSSELRADEYYADRVQQSKQAATEAKSNAESELAVLGKSHPILRESHLAEENKISRYAMANADEAGLTNLLVAHIAQKQEALLEVRKQILAKPELLYKVERLHPAFQKAMGFPKGGVCDQVIQDKKAQIEEDEFLTSFLLGSAGLVIGLASYGTATPWIAGLMATAGFGLSGYMAHQEYGQYVEDSEMSEFGFAQNPSLGWLVVAMVGAGLDMGAMVKSVKILSPAVKTINQTGDVAKFRISLQHLKQELQISDEAIEMIDKAALANWEAKWNGKQLQNFLTSKGMNIGQESKELDGLIKHFARAKVKEGYSSYEAFAEELNKLLEIQGVGKMGPSGLQKSKAVWSETFEEIASVRKKIKTRGETDRFALQYTDEDLLDLLSRGEELGLARREIEDFIFVGSKIEKRKSAKEMMEQMGNFKKVIEPRGFPYLFKNLDQFNGFKSKVDNLCKEFGLPGGDIRVQGSSLRTSGAGDIDVVVVLSQGEFDSLVERIYRYRDGLLNNAKSLKHKKKVTKYNSAFKRKMEKHLKHGKLSDYQLGRMDGKEDIFRARLYKILRSFEGGPKDIDFSIMSPKGRLNISPFLNF